MTVTLLNGLLTGKVINIRGKRATIDIGPRIMTASVDELELTQ